MDDNYKTPLIIECHPDGGPEPWTFRKERYSISDRGSNYTSAEFAGELEGLGIRQSVGRTGICYDNALAES